MARGTPTQRGYDSRWDALRNRYRAAHPLCEACWRRGVVRPMEDVDHVVPFTGLSDPRRLDPANLAALCRPCHHAKTAAERQRRGGA